MDILTKLACAIATAEGYFAGKHTVPYELNNPGDLLFADQLNAIPQKIKGLDGKTRIFAKFSCPEAGWAALYRQIAKRVTEGCTLRKMITDSVIGWAPAADGNDTNNYLTETVRRTGISPDVKLWTLLGMERLP